jgi:hypothetical protein
MRMAPGRSPQPKPNRKKLSEFGDAVPKPPGIYRFVARMAVLVGAAGAAPPIPAAGSALRSHPCVAVSSAQVRPV